MDLNDEVLKTIIFLDFMRKLVLVHAACCYLCYIIHQRQRLKRRRIPHIPTQSTIERQKVRDEIMSRLRNSEKCYDVIRMGPQAFQGLCDILRRDGDLQNTLRATIEVEDDQRSPEINFARSRVSSQDAISSKSKKR